MDIQIFDTDLEIFQFKIGEFPGDRELVIFEGGGYKDVRSGVVIYYKTRSPNIKVHGRYTDYVEFSSLKWWGRIKK